MDVSIRFGRPLLAVGGFFVMPGILAQPTQLVTKMCVLDYVYVALGEQLRREGA